MKSYEISDDANLIKWFRSNNKKIIFIEKSGFKILGPERAGKDIYLNKVLKDFPHPRPVDFVIFYKDILVAIGLIRYDSDRGGSQEDDRTSGYRGLIREILNFSKGKKIAIKILFINEGPGLCLGSMWEDYANLEDIGEGHVIVCTLKMINERLTKDWLLSN